MALIAKENAYIEVHKYRAGSMIVSAAVALLLQGFLPKYFPHAEVIELPLLVTVYFSMGRRNAASGLLLGAGAVMAAAACSSSFRVQISRPVSASTHPTAPQ